jgi:hypothetical protein
VGTPVMCVQLVEALQLLDGRRREIAQAIDVLRTLRSQRRRSALGAIEDLAHLVALARGLRTVWCETWMSRRRSALSTTMRAWCSRLVVVTA